MRSFLRKYIVIIVVVIIAIIGALIYFSQRNTTPTWTTDTVTTGTVSQIISISGTVDAVGTADLAFPVSGILENILVKEGDTVSKGQVIAILSHDDVKADYQDASAALKIARADLDELISGLRTEERDVTATTLEIATEELERVSSEQDDLVKNAYRTLLSTDLAGQPESKNNDATPPRITGNYTCKEGAYTLDIYRSGAQSGYSYRLTGIEDGTFSVYTDTSAPLGTCGLNIQFVTGESYGNSIWTIEIPNTKGASYVANRNAYDLALTKRENAIQEAKQNLILAKQNSTLDTATPRAEAVTRAQARVEQAEARLAVVSSQIKDHILAAPFDGVITRVDSVIGETIGTTPSFTMVSDTSFALTALVPEIDITKINVGQKADVVFDARQGEILPATTIFISPLAEEIDGVSYFEAKLTLDNPVPWLRSGLNADIDIIVDRHENVARIPKRYLRGTEGAYTVSLPNDDTEVPTPVTVTFMGNDGFVEIQGLNSGDTISAP